HDGCQAGEAGKNSRGQKMTFDVKKIREMAKKDFDHAWTESGKLVKREGRAFEVGGKGSPHPLWEIILRVRKVLLDLGFAETNVPVITHKNEVYAQYGNEAPVILDRVFFLAGLERPDIGIGRKKIAEIKKVLPGFKDVQKLQKIFRAYKEGRIAADDFTEKIAAELKVGEEVAGKIMSLFKELRDLRPVPTDLTLRSHTTAGWFNVLREMKRRQPLPLQLFSIGQKFRREQRLDETHLYESWTASVVVMAEEITLEDGKEITRKIFSGLGHETEIVEKKVTSRYYAPGTEFEVFIKHPKDGTPVEVADGGIYSPVALANYDIQFPVFNLGIGLERLAMIETGVKDVRTLVYPYRYVPVELSDESITKMIGKKEKPKSAAGAEVARAIVEVARRNAEMPSPCEFLVFEGEIEGRAVKVLLVEPEPKTKLIGPAGFNEVMVYDGNVVGVPPEGWEENEFIQAVRKRGVSTGITFMDAFAALAAAEIEKAAREGKKEITVRVRNVKQPSDINIEIDEVAARYITGKRKKIDVRGPMFTTVVATFS
ncbi:MAG: O-phosphoserine--tRNA ligase, partial [Candidatus Hadarchaeales archaeon]